MHLRIALFFAFLPAAFAADSRGFVDRVGTTGFVQLEAESFQKLTPREQALAYWLTQASIAIDPIIYDQLSAYGLREKRLLEGVIAHGAAGVPKDVFARIRSYTLLFWANRGNHNETTAQKFVPGFTVDELTSAALTAQASGAFASPSADLPPLRSADEVKSEHPADTAPQRRESRSTTR